ncbi:MAG: MFS transporter, partial [Streptomyces sp.]|nr:MFS transporter [Streptomyces sp.]
MATAEPTRADDADPGSDTSPRIRVPAPRTESTGDSSNSSGERGSGGDSRRADTSPGPEPSPPVPSRFLTAFLALRERILRHPVLSFTVLSGGLHIMWFFVFANSGGDLAAQDAWAEFVGRHPDSAYNLAWYGGMHPVSYSVVSPYLMSVLGVRTTMMIAGTV